jgi:hypothetical protein
MTGACPCLTTKGFSLRVSGQIHDTKIDTQGSTFGCIWIGYGDIKGYRKVEGPITIEQISLSLDAIETRLLVPSNAEGNKDATLKCQKRDLRETLKGHQALIKGDSTLSSEGGFDTLISFIDLSRLADGTNSHLRREAKVATHISIHELLQLEFVGKLLSVCDFRYSIARIVKGVYRLKQGLTYVVLD